MVMHYLFMGLFCDKNREAEYLAKARRGVQGAVNTFQWNLLDGFAAHGADMTVLNTMPVGVFPNNYRQLFFEKKTWKYENFPCTEIGFLNLPMIKQEMREHGYFQAAKQWVKDTPGEKTILIYSLYGPCLRATARLKRRYPDVKVCVIVTDLPGRYGVQRSKLKMWYDSRSLEQLNHIDSFVLLTEQMTGPLQVGDRPYVVVEGICNPNAGQDTVDVPEKKKAVLYTGSLNPVYGILDLVSAFEQIKTPDWELWICGKSGAEMEIRRRAEADPRIKYMGYRTKQEVYALQKQASLLVNPRKNEGEYTKYSFPSKTMEYMISGTPVLMYALDGVPKAYHKYGYFIGTEGLDSLEDGLCYAMHCSEEKRAQRGEAARCFVLHEKNSKVQAGKILTLLERQKKVLEIDYL